MSGAEGVLVLNIAVASLFAAAYAVIALANPSQRLALMFTASYLIGMLAPASDLRARPDLPLGPTRSLAAGAAAVGRTA